MLSFPAPLFYEDMRAYIIRRLLLVIPTLFILSVLVFLSVRFIPGDVIDVMALRIEAMGGGSTAQPWSAGSAWICRSPCSWIGASAARHPRRVAAGRLASRSACGTNRRARAAAILIGVIALPVGIYSAVRQYTAADYVGRSIAIMGLATPNFAGNDGDDLPGHLVGVSPPMELIPLAQDPLGNLGYIPNPGHLPASTMRMTRMMLEVLRHGRPGPRGCWSGRCPAPRGRSSW